MSESVIENSLENNEAVGLKILESHRFWAKKRVLFNLFVGVFGFASIIVFLGFQLVLLDVIGIVVWGLVANAFYSTGYVLDTYIIAKSKGEKSLQNLRNILFWTGTICYILFGFLFMMAYAIAIPD